ncbi:MAG: hydrogenase iron-sulfur subunit [Chloroflexi bacterium]|nr:hydrogenase iron-sulfur subunit [Chloroflexota bacterium]
MTEPRIVVFTCNWNAYSALEAAGYKRLAYPASVRPIKVMCLGRLHPGLILKAFELGADGVLLLGCPPGECHYEFGNQRAEELFQETRAIAHLLGIGDERLKLDWLGVGEGEAFVQKVMEFGEGLGARDQGPGTRD